VVSVLNFGEEEQGCEFSGAVGLGDGGYTATDLLTGEEVGEMFVAGDAVAGYPFDIGPRESLVLALQPTT
jgi:hypothetical protein